MSRSKRRNIDKKRGIPTSGGTRNGHEKACRNHWCCGRGWRKLESKRRRQEGKRDSDRED